LSYFSRAPRTSQLEAPEEIQHVGDFESKRTEPVEEEEEEKEEIPNLGMN
jgi:hypothetical protein